jgi:ribonuclease HI
MRAERRLVGITRIEMHSDSQYAIGVLDRGWRAHANEQLVAGLRKRLAAARNLYDVSIHWVRGHAGVDGNERADRLARDSMSLSKTK